MPLLAVMLLFAVNFELASDQNEWPPVRPGIWEESGTRTLPNGKSTTVSGVRIQSCGAPEAIFMSWAGSSHAVLEEAGCSYEARHTAEKTWRIVTECDLRGVGRSRGESIVTLRSDSEFESVREFREGQQLYRLHLVARRMADCPK